MSSLHVLDLRPDRPRDEQIDTLMLTVIKVICKFTTHGGGDRFDESIASIDAPDMQHAIGACTCMLDHDQG